MPLYARRFRDAAELRAAIHARRVELAGAHALRREDAEGDGGALDIVQQLGDDLGAAPRIELAVSEDGAQIWTTTIGESTAEHGTRAEAFGAVEDSEWFAAALGRKNPDADAYQSLADWRWFDAASVEDLPSSYDGSQIQEQMIQEMARNLARAQTPIPFDGGGVSQVHETMWNSSASAAGWGFAAIEVVGADAKAHLWLFGRLLSDVDERVNEGSILFGSILFIEADTDRYGDGEPIGARLISYALTNTPFVDGLEPHAPRAQRMPTQPQLALCRSRRISAIRRSRPMNEQKLRQILAALGVPSGKNAHGTRAAFWRAVDKSARSVARGPVNDKLAELATLLGLDAQNIDAWDVYDAVRALEDMAQIETIIEAMGLAPAMAPAAAPAAASAGMRAEAAEIPEAWAPGMVGLLREVFGQPEATPDELMTLVKASKDALTAAVTEAGGGGEDNEGADMSDENAKAAEVIGLKSQQKKLTEEIAQLRKETRRNKIESHIDRRWRGAGLVDKHTGELLLTTEERTELVEMAERQGDGWEKLIDIALRGINKPPGGTVDDPNPSERTQPTRDETRRGTTQTPSSQLEAIREAQAVIAKEQPALKGAELRVAAARRAASEHPALFTPRLFGAA